MTSLRFTLLTDGSSDKALIPHLTWLLKENGVSVPIYSEWAELRHLPIVPKGLSEKITKSLELYPCDLVFIHRDAEKEPSENRKTEIATALSELSEVRGMEVPVSVCVISIRMLEAWLLSDEQAIRRASGNPYGKTSLGLPKLNQIEDLKDPKETLRDILRTASELSGRRLRKLNFSNCVSQISEYIEDFSPLRNLSAFTRLEDDIKTVIEEQNWK
jgi:hypothetical protein